MEKINNILPDPVDREDQYLAYIATGVGELPEYPIFRKEFYLDYIAKHGGGGGGFTPTDEQLAAMNSGITSTKLTQLETKAAKALVTPVSTPVENLITGVDTTNSQAMYAAGVGIELSGNTSPYDIDVVGFDYSETEPTEANTDGLKVVVLDAEPETKYDGWLYLIKEA